MTCLFLFVGMHQTKMGNVFDKMEDGLWLGSKDAYNEPDQDTFKAIVTALTEQELHAYKIREKVGDRPWLYIPIDDTPEADLAQHFLEVIHFIQAAREQGQNVLVHCAAGVRRSATLVCAYLMWEHRWTRKQALEYVIARRKIVDPNDGFMNQLAAFERVLKELGRQKDAPVDKNVEQCSSDKKVESQSFV